MFQKSRSEDQQQDCLHSEDKNRSIWRTASATKFVCVVGLTSLFIQHDIQISQALDRV